MRSLARLSLARDDPARAARLYAAASVIAERVSSYPMPGGRADPVRSIADVEAALPRDEFAEAWAQGRSMTLDEAVFYAYDEPVRELAAAEPKRDACKHAESAFE
jgi:hypothetical protein